MNDRPLFVWLHENGRLVCEKWLCGTDMNMRQGGWRVDKIVASYELTDEQARFNLNRLESIFPPPE